MPRSPDEILAAELQKLAEERSGKKFGSAAVRWVAMRLPNDAHQIELEFEASPETVLRVAMEVLRELGTLRDDVAHESPNPVVAGIVGSGLLNLNPALVRVAVTSVAGNRTGAIVAGTAKEGLIKQHAGEKAAKKVAEAIRQRLAAR